MNLRAAAVNRKMKAYQEVIRLLKTAFPVEEQYPVWFLRLLALRKEVDFLAFFEGEQFVGLTYTLQCDRMVFVLYLAVNPEVRSKGCGTAILSWLKTHFAGKSLTLNIEPLDPKAENYDQRVKRFSFYAKNGFRDTGLCVKDGDDQYAVLCDAGAFQPEVYRKLLEKMSFGMIKPEICPAEKENSV